MTAVSPVEIQKSRANFDYRCIFWQTGAFQGATEEKGHPTHADVATKISSSGKVFQARKDLLCSLSYIFGSRVNKQILTSEVKYSLVIIVCRINSTSLSDGNIGERKDKEST